MANRVAARRPAAVYIHGAMNRLLRTIVALVAAASPALGGAPIPVRVSETVELLSVVFRLAGADEYRTAPADAPYVKAADAHFSPHTSHEVFRMVKELRAERGVGYDAVMSLAVHLKDARSLEPKIPWEEAGDSLEKRWTPDRAARFAKALRSFAEASKAAEFFDAHADYYKQAADGLAQRLTARPYREWMDSFFGVRPDASGGEFLAIVGLLNGGGSYGVSVRHPDGRSEICPVIGAGEFDKAGLPVFGEGDAGLIVHEFSHTYTNPLVDRFASALLPAARDIYPKREALMKPQAYGAPLTMLYESMVRACSVRFLVAHGTPEEAEQRIAFETARGFLWTRGLSGLLAEYERGRAMWPALEDFMPRIVEFFGAQAKTIDEAMARLPKVVRISPADGSKDVASGDAEIVVVFDRPMKRGSYAITGDPAKTPRALPGGRPLLSEDGRTFTLPVSLEPGRTYEFGLNSVRRAGFWSADGWPLDPVRVTFTTASP